MELDRVAAVLLLTLLGNSLAAQEPRLASSNSAIVAAYYPNWVAGGRQYFVKNIHTSGAAEKLTHIVYAFGDVNEEGLCELDSRYADYERAYSSAESIDGVPDAPEAPLKGNINQLRKLKIMYPHIKVLFSFGGWTLSSNFGTAAKDPNQFAESCYGVVYNSTWANVFDGIDIDWEYPNACGLTCDTSGRYGFRDVMVALRNRFGHSLVTAAISGDASTGGVLDAADYTGAIAPMDFVMIMSYTYFGPWSENGPTAPHSPLTAYPGIPNEKMTSEQSVAKIIGMGVPSSKIVLGISFNGRGWTGVTQSAPGGSATGPGEGSSEPGADPYRVLMNTCPPTGKAGGTSYAFCPPNWWGYDTPETIGGKMEYVKATGLRGAFAWELSSDTSDAVLLSAMSQVSKQDTKSFAERTEMKCICNCLS